MMQMFPLTVMYLRSIGKQLSNDTSSIWPQMWNICVLPKWPPKQYFFYYFQSYYSCNDHFDAKSTLLAQWYIRSMRKGKHTFLFTFTMTNAIYIENNGKQTLVTSTSFILSRSVYNTLSMTWACTFTSTEGHARLPLYTTFARGFAVLRSQIASSGKSRAIMGDVVYRSWSEIGQN